MPTVTSVSRDEEHNFSKPVMGEIVLLEGLGVEGDSHCGVTTQHRYLVKKDPGRANLCQVHLLQSELYDDLAQKGYNASAGQLGENVTTAGIDLMSLPLGALVNLGETAVLEITGRRSPCNQINGLAKGLMKAVFAADEAGKKEPRAGVMSVVRRGGVVRAGDSIHVTAPAGPALPLPFV